jgi:rhodanese-related sulfurtransferase
VGPALLTPQEVNARLSGDHPPIVIDVREADEVEIARLDGAVHVPLSRFRSAIESLDRHAEYVVVCHHGIRSGQAATLMTDRGFMRVANLLGGLDAWAREVDPSMPRY